MPFIINYIIVTRPLTKPEVNLPEISIPEVSEFGQNNFESIGTSQEESYSYNDIDLSGLPSYYYNPFSLLMSAFSSLIWVLILAIMLQAIIWGLISVFFLVKQKEYKCPKCKRKFKYTKKKPKRCMYCGAQLEEELKAH